MSLRLHEIISKLLGETNFFLAQSDAKEKEIDSDQFDCGFRVISVSPLDMYQKQKIEYFPSKVKKLLPKSSYRFGIQQQDPSNPKTNISFLNSINCFLVEDLYRASAAQQTKEFKNLRSVLLRLVMPSRKRNNLRSRIERNIIDNDVIQIVCNIFQINLLMIDLVEENAKFFYCYFDEPMIHFYRPLYYISKLDTGYEPILFNGKINVNSCYLTILNSWNTIEKNNQFTISGGYFEYFNRIGISNETYVIMQNHIKKEKSQDIIDSNDSSRGRKNNERNSK